MALKWLIRNSKKQLFPLILLTVIDALYALCGVAFALLNRGIIDNAVAKNIPFLTRYAIGMAFAILLSLILRIGSHGLMEQIKTRLTILYQRSLINELVKKNYMQLGNYHSGKFMNRFFSDIPIISDGFTTILPKLVFLMTKVIFGIGVLFVLNRNFTFLLLAGGLFIIGLTSLFRKKMKFLHKKAQERLGYVHSFIQESMASLLIIKVFGAEKKTLDHASELQEDYYKIQMKRRTFSILAGSSFGFAFELAYLFALLVGANGLIMGTMTYGTLTAILQLVGQVQQPFANLSGLLPKYYSVIASVERIIEIEDMENEPRGPLLNANSIYRDMFSITGQGLSFTYGRNTIFNQVDFTIQKGDFVSITGLSGTGKSTLFLLLMGIYVPLEGSLHLHTKDGKQPLGRLTRRLFAYVPQGNYLFSGTVRENIAFLSSEASDEDIRDVAYLACVTPFLETLPEGLETLIGERGFGLSEGQVQRIAIARALLSGAPILLLDEATSALDEVTEVKLLENISSLKNKTCLIVSHRKLAMKYCNKHIYIKSRKIVTTLPS